MRLTICLLKLIMTLDLNSLSPTHQEQPYIRPSIHYTTWPNQWHQCCARNPRSWSSCLQNQTPLKCFPKETAEEGLSVSSTEFCIIFQEYSSLRILQLKEIGNNVNTYYWPWLKHMYLTKSSIYTNTCHGWTITSKLKWEKEWLYNKVKCSLSPSHWNEYKKACNVVNISLKHAHKFYCQYLCLIILSS